MKKMFLVLLLSFFSINVYAAWNDVFFGKSVTRDGTPSMVNWIDMPTASTTALLGVNGVSIATATLVSAGTTFVDGASGTSNQFTQITFPRNVQLVAYTPGATFTTLSGNCLITGTNGKGVSTTETVAITTNAVSSNNAWDTIDSFAYSGFTINSSASSVSLHIGTNNKIGIPGDVRNSSDVVKITEAGVDVSTCALIGGCVSARYDTIDLSKIVIPNSSIDYIIKYLSDKHYFGKDNQ